MTQGFEAIIDSSMIPLVDQFNWWPKKDKRATYARTKKIHNGKTIYLHRLIMDAPDHLEVDHINSNPLDNRKENLRLATHKENMRNSRINENSTTGLKGVMKIKNYNKWVAHISINNKKVYLGIFDSANDAAVAYTEASNKFHGEFGRTQ